MNEARPRRSLRLQRAAIALAVAIVVGAGAVYVSGAWTGNAHRTAAADGAGGNPDCAAAAGKAKALDAKATGAVAAMHPPDEPRYMGDIAFEHADGSKATLADRAGRTLLVNVWATWCVPCRTEMPELDALQAKKGGPDFEVVAINVDTGAQSKPAAFLKKAGVTHLALTRDASMKVFDDLRSEGLALGLPVSLLIGTHGCLLAAMNGPAAWGGPDAAKLIDAAVSLDKARQQQGGKAG
ncbi:thiol:disulfide interchange protein TlpA [Pararhizobium mangrovi]|uniref:TlpA family protein disulfide reductase n=1 Tax=Pararhizobium mangrovi TaxID=2590452 RepID=A0A506U5R9_9HYPH|nr:TlpA disulfide reductase family protein [Pararhizobium mangrovi]TPW27287.1 TlpA family protein disulfide reductase [Pararhizobium mangrovi]